MFWIDKLQIRPRRLAYIPLEYRERMPLYLAKWAELTGSKRPMDRERTEAAIALLYRKIGLRSPLFHSSLSLPLASEISSLSNPEKTFYKRMADYLMKGDLKDFVCFYTGVLPIVGMIATFWPLSLIFVFYSVILSPILSLGPSVWIVAILLFLSYIWFPFEYFCSLWGNYQILEALLYASLYALAICLLGGGKSFLQDKAQTLLEQWQADHYLGNRWHRKLNHQVNSSLHPGVRLEIQYFFETATVDFPFRDDAGTLNKLYAPERMSLNQWARWMGRMDFCITELHCVHDAELWNALQTLVRECDWIVPLKKSCWLEK